MGPAARMPGTLISVDRMSLPRQHFLRLSSVEDEGLGEEEFMANGINSANRVRTTPFGPRYEVEGELIAPNGRRPRVCLVWQHDEGQIAARLITAYPVERIV